MEDFFRYLNITELSHEDEIYSKTIDCDIQLKPHQLVMLQKCIQRESSDIDVSCCTRYDTLETDVGIIADKAGSGKSYTILALIASQTIPRDTLDIRYTYGHGHFNVKCKKHNWIDKNVNVLVIPHILTRQWCTYIETFSKSLSYFCANKNKGLDSLEANIDKYSIILVTGSFYKHIKAMFYLNNWRAMRVIFDEVDSTTTPSSTWLPCRFMWCVTASYKNILFPIHKVHYDRRNIQNSYVLSNGITNNAFVKNMFITALRLMGNFELNALDSIILKNNDSFVDESLKLPVIFYNTILCSNPIEVNILSGLVNVEIINSLNAGDVSTAFSFISTVNLDSESNIIGKALIDLKNATANLQWKRTAIENTIYSTNTSKDTAISRVTDDILEHTKKIEMMTERIQNNELCVICYAKPFHRSISKCCQNSYCLQCITRWLTFNNVCPLCKKDASIQKDFFVVNASNTEDRHNAKLDAIEMSHPPGQDAFTLSKTKFDNLYRLLMNRKSYSKFLIFSDFEKSFENMYPYLNKTDIRYSHVKGNSVKNVIEKYKGDQLDALLINSKHYGSGINLENTTDVILFHKFEDQMEKQVIGRAQRIGRSTPLNVWYFLNENES